MPGPTPCAGFSRRPASLARKRGARLQERREGRRGRGAGAQAGFRGYLHTRTTPNGALGRFLVSGIPPIRVRRTNSGPIRAARGPSGWQPRPALRSRRAPIWLAAVCGRPPDLFRARCGLSSVVRRHFACVAGHRRRSARWFTALRGAASWRPCSSNAWTVTGSRLPGASGGAEQRRGRRSGRRVVRSSGSRGHVTVTSR